MKSIGRSGAIGYEEKTLELFKTFLKLYSGLICKNARSRYASTGQDG